MNNRNRVLCIGEILWDSLPLGLFLGGAPLNVCYHLNQFGIDATISSRVGDDRLGHEAIRRIKNMGISTDLIQIDKELETGFVEVELTKSGDPGYSILKPVAWDCIKLLPALENRMRDAWGLVYGSLAQREETSRSTIQRLWEYDVRLIFDMNLRLPFVNKEVVHNSLQVANIAKMNEEELNQIAKWYSLSENPRSAVEDLSELFNCSIICITRGVNGSMLFYKGNWFEHEGFPIKVKDSVGAGDAFLAALIYGIINEKEDRELLAYANAAGSLIAQKDGATPRYTINDVLNRMV